MELFPDSFWEIQNVQFSTKYSGPLRFFQPHWFYKRLDSTTSSCQRLPPLLTALAEVQGELEEENLAFFRVKTRDEERMSEPVT